MVINSVGTINNSSNSETSVMSPYMNYEHHTINKEKLFFFSLEFLIAEDSIKKNFSVQCSDRILRCYLIEGIVLSTDGTQK